MMPRRFSRVANSSRAFANRFVIVPFANPNDAAVCACDCPLRSHKQQHLAQRQRHTRELLVDDRPEIVFGFCRLHPFGFGR